MPGTMAQHFYILVTFLVNICPKPLRETFMKFAKNDKVHSYTTLSGYLANRMQEIDLLQRKRILNNRQYKIVTNSKDVESWDITLLCIMLENLFPSPVGILSSHIKDIRDERNKIQHISGTAEVSDTLFSNAMKTLENATLALANRHNKDALKEQIDNIKTSYIANIADVLREWNTDKIMQLEDLVNELNAKIEDVKEDTTVNRRIVKKGSVKRTWSGGKIIYKRIRTVDPIIENMGEPRVQWKRDNDPNYKSLVAKSVSYFHEYSRVNVKEKYLESAREKFRAKKSVVLSGPRGCGKTALALSLLRSYQDGHYVVVTDPDELTYVRFGFTCVILIEDLGGKYFYDRNVVQKWLQKFEILNAAVQQGKMNVIITCETDRLNTIRTDIFRHSLLENEVSIGTDGVVAIKQENGTLSNTKVISGISSLRGPRCTQVSEGQVKELNETRYNITAICQCPDGSYITLCDMYLSSLGRRSRVLVRLDSRLQETHRYTSLPDKFSLGSARDLCCTPTRDLVVLFWDNVSIHKVGDKLSLLKTISLGSGGGHILVSGNRICHFSDTSITFYDLNLKQKGQVTNFPCITDDFDNDCIFFQNQLFCLYSKFFFHVNTQEKQMKYIHFDELFNPLSICCIDEESMLVLGYQNKVKQGEEVTESEVWRILQLNGSLDVLADITCDRSIKRLFEFNICAVYDRVNKKLVVANWNEMVELHLQCE